MPDRYFITIDRASLPLKKRKRCDECGEYRAYNQITPYEGRRRAFRWICQRCISECYAAEGGNIYQRR